MEGRGRWCSRSLAGLVLAVMACSPGSQPRDSGPADVRPDAARCDPTAAPVAVAGTWALRAALSLDLLQHPGGIVRLCPDPQPTQALMYFLLRVTASGGGVYRHVAQLCQVGLPTAHGLVGDCSAGTALAIGMTPSAALDAYVPTHVIAPFDIDLGEARPCTRWRTDTFRVLLGVRDGALANPDTDPLPGWCGGCPPASAPDRGSWTAADCLCRDCARAGRGTCETRASEIVDTDGDGQPGVTVTLESDDPGASIHGDIYLSMRIRPRFDGIIRSANLVTGQVEAPVEYGLLNSNVLIAGPTDPGLIVNALPGYRFTTPGDFKMMRADGDQLALWDADANGMVTCADVLRRPGNFNY